MNLADSVTDIHISRNERWKFRLEYMEGLQRTIRARFGILCIYGSGQDKKAAKYMWWGYWSGSTMMGKGVTNKDMGHTTF